VNQTASRKLILIPILLAALPVAAEVIWRGDFETGTTKQWKGARKSDAVRIVTDPVREGEKVVPLVKTATLADKNEAFFQVGLFRDTSEVPATIILDHVVEATSSRKSLRLPKSDEVDIVEQA
jgi:hypothetical protein